MQKWFYVIIFARLFIIERIMIQVLPPPESIENTLDRLFRSHPNTKIFLGIIGIQGDGKSTWLKKIAKRYGDLFSSDQLLDLDFIFDATEGDDRTKRTACVQAIYDRAKKGSFVVELLPMHDMEGYLQILRQIGFHTLGLFYPMAGSREENIRRVFEREGSGQFPEAAWREWIKKMDIQARKIYLDWLESKELDFSLVIDNSEYGKEKVLFEYNKGVRVRGVHPLPQWVEQRFSPPSKEEASWFILRRGLPEFPSIQDVIQREDHPRSF